MPNRRQPPSVTIAFPGCVIRADDAVPPEPVGSSGSPEARHGALTTEATRACRNALALASAGAYGLTVHALAQGIGQAIHPLAALPAIVATCLLASLLPIALLRLQVWWIVQSDRDDARLAALVGS